MVMRHGRAAVCGCGAGRHRRGAAQADGALLFSLSRSPPAHHILLVGGLPGQSRSARDARVSPGLCAHGYDAFRLLELRKRGMRLGSRRGKHKKILCTGRGSGKLSSSMQRVRHPPWTHLVCFLLHFFTHHHGDDQGGSGQCQEGDAGRGGEELSGICCPPARRSPAAPQAQQLCGCRRWRWCSRPVEAPACSPALVGPSWQRRCGALWRRTQDRPGAAGKAGRALGQTLAARCVEAWQASGRSTARRHRLQAATQDPGSSLRPTCRQALAWWGAWRRQATACRSSRGRTTRVRRRAGWPALATAAGTWSSRAALPGHQMPTLCCAASAGWYDAQAKLTGAAQRANEKLSER